MSLGGFQGIDPGQCVTLRECSSRPKGLRRSAAGFFAALRMTLARDKLWNHAFYS
jgi:hypothetical protein